MGHGQSTTGVRKACFWHLLKQCVVGAIQVELAQVVPVGKDEKWLLICRGRVLAQLWYPRLYLQQLWFPPGYLQLHCIKPSSHLSKPTAA